MKLKYTFSIVFIFFIKLCSAQIVIGSTNAAAGAALKLDSNSKALRIPNLPVTSRPDAISPISGPSLGVMLYNTNSDIDNDIARSITYWGSDNNYHSMASYNSTEEIIQKAKIPQLIFSAAIGQKPIVPSGSANGGTNTTLVITNSEVLFDKYLAWDYGNNQYKMPSTGTYLIEFVSNMSASTGGTLVHRTFKNGTLLLSNNGRYIQGTMFTTTSYADNFLLNDLIRFAYIYTANNYRMENGTVNIYKYQ